MKILKIELKKLLHTKTILALFVAFIAIFIYYTDFYSARNLSTINWHIDLIKDSIEQNEKIQADLEANGIDYGDTPEAIRRMELNHLSVQAYETLDNDLLLSVRYESALDSFDTLTYGSKPDEFYLSLYILEYHIENDVKLLMSGSEVDGVNTVYQLMNTFAFMIVGLTAIILSMNYSTELRTGSIKILLNTSFNRKKIYRQKILFNTLTPVILVIFILVAYFIGVTIATEMGSFLQPTAIAIFSRDDYIIVPFYSYFLQSILVFTCFSFALTSFCTLASVLSKNLIVTAFSGLAVSSIMFFIDIKELIVVPTNIIILCVSLVAFGVITSAVGALRHNKMNI